MIHARSLDVKRNTVGDHHPLLCQTYTCLSVIETLRGDEEKALQYNQLAVDIYKVHDDRDIGIQSLYM